MAKGANISPLEILKVFWSALNKRYIEELTASNLLHEIGSKIIDIGKLNGSWTALDATENSTIPEDLKVEFSKNPQAFENYNSFAPSCRKNYLNW